MHRITHRTRTPEQLFEVSADHLALTRPPSREGLGPLPFWARPRRSGKLTSAGAEIRGEARARERQKMPWTKRTKGYTLYRWHAMRHMTDLVMLGFVMRPIGFLLFVSDNTTFLSQEK